MFDNLFWVSPWPPSFIIRYNCLLWRWMEAKAHPLPSPHHRGWGSTPNSFPPSLLVPWRSVSRRVTFLVENRFLLVPPLFDLLYVVPPSTELFLPAPPTFSTKSFLITHRLSAEADPPLASFRMARGLSCLLFLSFCPRCCPLRLLWDSGNQSSSRFRVLFALSHVLPSMFPPVSTKEERWNLPLAVCRNLHHPL